MKQECACLLIHGFGGNKEEVIPLEEPLRNHNYNVYNISLKGHTGCKNDLKSVKYTDWIDCVKEEVDNLKCKYQKVYIIGFSMGGLIAINMALEYELSGIITINAPIYYWDIKRIILNILEDIKSMKANHLKRYINSTNKLPIKALNNFRMLLVETIKKVNYINCPIFILQGEKDDTVRKKSANYIFNNVSSKDKEIKFYPQSGHLMLWSENKDDAIKDILDFLNIRNRN